MTIPVLAYYTVGKSEFCRQHGAVLLDNRDYGSLAEWADAVELHLTIATEFVVMPYSAKLAAELDDRGVAHVVVVPSVAQYDLVLERLAAKQASAALLDRVRTRMKTELADITVTTYGRLVCCYDKQLVDVVDLLRKEYARTCTKAGG